MHEWTGKNVFGAVVLLVVVCTIIVLGQKCEQNRGERGAFTAMGEALEGKLTNVERCVAALADGEQMEALTDSLGGSSYRWRVCEDAKDALGSEATLTHYALARIAADQQARGW